MCHVVSVGTPLRDVSPLHIPVDKMASTATRGSPRNRGHRDTPLPATVSGHVPDRHVTYRTGSHLPKETTVGVLLEETSMRIVFSAAAGAMKT